MEYIDLPIEELHQALVNRKTSPFELTKVALARAHASKENAFEIIDDEEALAYAASLVDPEEDNLLWGIPFLAKDNFSTKDLPTTASSNILASYRPVFDAAVIERLKAKKMVLIGKTTLDELAMGGTGTTGHLGITYNPYDPTHQRMVGGSSCGSAAAVASGIVPFALGSDTGDSVRKPASFAGLVGFKPTWGRISRYGLFPFAPSLDHVAYFTRDVKMAASVLEALGGRDDRDSTSSLRPVEPYCELLNKNTGVKRIAVIKEIQETIKDNDVLLHFSKAVEALRKEGYIVEEVSYPLELLQSLFPTYIVISCAEATSNDANLDGIKFGPFKGGNTYEEVMKRARSEGFSELIKRRFVIGSFALMRENQEDLFLRAQRNRAKIVSELNKIYQSYDFIMTPAAPSIAPRFEDSSDRLSNEYLIADSHLCLGNFAGLPSITLPLFLKDNLPVGINFMGRAFEEANLLALSSQFERLSGLAELSTVTRKEGNL